MSGHEGGSPTVAEAMRRLLDAWNRRDSDAFGSLFTPAADYVTGAGRHVRGRDAIAALLDASRNPPLVEVVDGPFVELGDATATARFGWSTAGADGSRGGTITCSLAWHGTGWLIEALDNAESG